MMMNLLSCYLLAAGTLLCSSVHGFAPQQPMATTSCCSPTTLLQMSSNSMDDNRRSILLSGIVASTAAIVASSSPDTSAAMEEEDFSNEFIQTLKARSDAKRDEYNSNADNGNIAWKKLNTATFKGQYDRPKFIGVQRPDQTFQMVTPEQLEELERSNKIYKDYTVYVNPKNGKEEIDYSRGPIWKFSENSSPSSSTSNSNASESSEEIES
mmetsp:Transcript_1419/g.2111  ORF Transcript_1419/g.2111 Transcript_1419/m.2111 type:complete len:211 (-) Transcript_1419:34-666(-)